MDDFFGKNYMRFLAIPIIILFILLFLIFIYPGVEQGTDLKGGNVIILRSDKELVKENIETVLNNNFNLVELKVSTIASPTGFGAWIEYSKDPTISEAERLLELARINIDDETQSIDYSKQAISLLEGKEKNYDNSKIALKDGEEILANYKETFSVNLQNTLSNELALDKNVEFQKKEISPTLGNASLQGMLTIAIIGFILITIVIFFAFRQIVPSGAILLAMIFDILAGLAGMSILNIPLSLTTMPALLLLVGYSVDTDIMLTSKLLKEKGGTHSQRATSSMKTGLTMTGTTLAALLAMIIVSYFYQIEVIYHISAILLFGLVGDIISTWFMNAPILLKFVEGKK